MFYIVLLYQFTYQSRQLFECLQVDAVSAIHAALLNTLHFCVKSVISAYVP